VAIAGGSSNGEEDVGRGDVRWERLAPQAPPPTPDSFVSAVTGGRGGVSGQK